MVSTVKFTISTYLGIFKDCSYMIKIFQSENISDIIGNFDVVVSYDTGAQTEIIAIGARLILIRTDPPLSHAQLVSEGTSSETVSCTGR